VEDGDDYDILEDVFELSRKKSDLAKQTQQSDLPD
jgi:hypothetical protein